MLLLFPLEVWALIGDELSAEDLIQLLQTCKKLNTLLKSDLLWRPKVTKRWFKPRERWFDFENNIQNKHYEHYCTRRTLDNDLNSFLSAIAADPKLMTHNSFLKKTNSVFDQLELYVPELVRISARELDLCASEENGIERLKKRLSNPRKVYVASQLLEAMRYYKIFDTLHRISVRKETPRDGEEALVRLSMINPHYFEECYHRQRFYNMLIASYQICEPGNSGLVLGRVRTLAHLLTNNTSDYLGVDSWDDLQYDDRQLFRKMGCTNILQVLRVYSLDVGRCYKRHSRGSPLALASILQKLCEKLNLPSKQYGRYLEIEDPDLPAGRVFVEIDQEKLYEYEADEFLREHPDYRNHGNEDFNLLIGTFLLFTNVLTWDGGARHMSSVNHEIFNTFKQMTTYFQDTLESEQSGSYRISAKLEVFARDILSYRTPFFALGLLHLFRDKPEMSELCHVLERKISQEQVNFGDQVRADGIFYPLLNEDHNDLQTGRIVYVKDYNEYAVIVGFCSGYTNPICYGSSSAIYMVNASSLELNRPPENYIIQKLCQYPQLGSWFTAFDWDQKRFISAD